MVEPIAGVLGAAGVTLAAPVLPYALAFAAGAMIYVVIDDIIPEAYQRYVHRIINCPVENSRLSLSLSLSLSSFSCFSLFLSDTRNYALTIAPSCRCRWDSLQKQLLKSDCYLVAGLRCVSSSKYKRAILIDGTLQSALIVAPIVELLALAHVGLHVGILELRGSWDGSWTI